MIEIKKEARNEKLIQELLRVWESSVKATHLFLANKEIEKIKKYVPEALVNISHLIIEIDEKKNPIAFWRKVLCNKNDDINERSENGHDGTVYLLTRNNIHNK